MNMQKTTLAGFEPTRATPNGFQVHLLNHSDKVSYSRLESRTRSFKPLLVNEKSP